MIVQLFDKIFAVTTKLLLSYLWYIIALLRRDKHYIVFIPHSGMCINDKYSIINPNSDSALTFANYIINNNLLPDYEIVIIDHIGNNTYTFQSVLNDLSTKRKIHILYGINEICDLCIASTKIKWIFYKYLSSAKYVFASSPYYNLFPFSKAVPVINLNYYSAPFKNDIHDSFNYKLISDKRIRYWMTSSGLTMRLELPIYNINFKSYLNFGLCRNDALIKYKADIKIRELILKDVPYKVNRIALYIPTHRDYEQGMHSSRNILGFETDLEQFNEWLIEQGVLIICKVHPKQNSEAIAKELPPSIVIHQPTEEYGLCELMQLSDCLITDYTSGYFDYLLLDKPVIFNFYDESRYAQTRGFTFDPISSVLTGEVITDCSSLKTALINLDSSASTYREKRKFLRDLLFKYQDGDSCRRIYDYFFKEDNNYINYIEGASGPEAV